jgi:DNA polymerase theta
MTSSGIRVEGFFGGYHPPGGFENIDLAVCTIEKANSIINKLLEHDKLNTVGMIVIDEVHLISDSSRGYILELLLTKILYMCEKFQHQIQLVTMSATLPNVELLRKWLKAEFYSTDYRPVELREMIKIDKDIFDHKMQFLRKVDMSFEEFFEESGDVCLLAMETIMENCQLICFCPTKEWCSKLSLKLASGIHKLIQNRAEIMNQIVDQKRIQLLRGQLKSLPSGVDEELIRYTSCGVAFHHAGLTTDERDLVEMGFKDGILKALFATSTLSSGVNLPARRVIIRTPMFGYNKKMSNLTYRQMIGRAGRKGKDTKGESILCCTNAEVKFGKELVEAPLDPIKSCLDQDGHAHLKRALLEIIASGMANTKDDLEKFVNSTLFCQENDINYNYFENDHDGDEKISKKSLEDLNNEKTKEKSNDPIKSSMDFLIQYEFIRIHNDEENGNKKFVPTRLGLACLSSAIPPKDGFILFSELQKSRQNFVLESELHAVYLVTPFSVAYQLQNIDWGYFHDVFDKLPDMMKRVGHMVGVSDSYLIKAIMGKQSSDWKSQQIHKR